jgi:hypothetical protein
MIRSRLSWTLAGLSALTSLAFLSLAASGDENAQRQQRTNNVSANGATRYQASAQRAARHQPASLRDVTKRVIETPTKRLIAVKSAPAAAFVNPKVQPGKVRWHPTFAAACLASAKSKKPVLLFHLLGKLDNQFC